ncbi:Universal stress protein family, tandem protein [Caballeronia sordidicola]|uniref:Universal stress protein family, tandem protein n=1 Tax=Caballeronia sordidicola TaxID=196367 RepID=A0A226WLV6_CABSO|nr:Universal stress protein family, tandem protein [Caballeronia sordidicola]
MMSYKSIVVQRDTSERAQSRLEYALQLAKQFDAHVSSVFSAFTPDPRSFYVMAGSAEYFGRTHAARAQLHAGACTNGRLSVSAGRLSARRGRSLIHYFGAF